jgi:glycosyltransferase involved in cell wall biosynthesis
MLLGRPMREKLDMVHIGIILPALNEEDSLERVVSELINTLSRHNYTYNIIIVNDGSTDRTASICNMLDAKYSNLSVIHNQKSENIGSCYLKAANLLNSEFITWLPTDGEIDIAVLPKMLSVVDNKSIAIPYPNHGLENRNLMRRFLSISFINIMNILFRTNIKYFNGNSIVPKNIIDQNNFLSNGFTINSEIIVYALNQCKLKPIEVPFQLKSRIGGQEKAISIRNLIDVINSTFKIYKKYRV